MCGILGVVQAEPRALDLPKLIEMCDSISHRGPDDAGYLLANHRSGALRVLGGKDTPSSVYAHSSRYSPEGKIEQHPPGESYSVALAHRRLSIIDLSPAGHQPLSNSDGSLWIAYNGEIYNHPEIRRDLESRGHQFFSNGDTEVVLRAYEEWGPACLSRFNGMWAFAILDLRENKLFCARDRIGIKPFYYAATDRGLIFASELKAIVKSGHIEAKPNDMQIHTFLYTGQDNVYETFFEDVVPLQPGHSLTFDLDRGDFSVDCYYTLPLGERLTGQSDEDYRRGFYDQLKTSVQYRLVADVPVGTCLSGGLDSSSIVCMVDKLMREDGLKVGDSDLQCTFSARYDDPRHDEGEYIKTVVEATRTNDHHTYPTGARLRDEVDNFIWHHEEPLQNTSIYAQWCVFDLVNSSKDSGVKVTLDGQGGDEILGGYHRYFATRNANLLRHFRFGEFIGEARGIERHHGQSKLSTGQQAALTLLPMGLKDFIRPLFPDKGRPAWLDKKFADRCARDPRWAAHQGSAIRWDTGNAFEWDLHRSVTRGIPRLLRYADRSSMAHSIESRVPFLDHNLVEYSLSLPDDQKIRQGMTKYVLRDSMTGILPESVRMRQSKIGFSTPQDTWFQEELRDFVETTLDSESFLARPYFDTDQVRNLAAQHSSGDQSVHADVWRLVNLEIWMRKFLD
jgi:asparagine synthase (glutamine-hydrolysing)